MAQLGSKISKIVVTGISSFVGAHLAHDLSQEGFDVVGTVTQSLDQYDSLRKQRIDHAVQGGAQTAVLDITRKDQLEALVESHRPDVWIHHGGWAANYGSPDYDMTRGQAINVDPLDVLYPLLKQYGCRGVIVTGSSAEYSNQDAACLESDVCDPEMPYGQSKLAATRRAQILAEKHQLPTRVARVFIPYGYLDAPQKLIPSVIEALSEEKAIDLSPCEQARDFVLVDDLVAGYGCLIQDLERDCLFDVFNLCSGVATPLRRFLEGLCEQLGADASLLGFGQRPMRPGEPPVSYGSHEKARAVLQWQPRTLEEGLACYLARDKRVRTPGV